MREDGCARLREMPQRIKGCIEVRLTSISGGRWSSDAGRANSVRTKLNYLWDFTQVHTRDLRQSLARKLVVFASICNRRNTAQVAYNTSFNYRVIDLWKNHILFWNITQITLTWKLQDVSNCHIYSGYKLSIMSWMGYGTLFSMWGMI